MQEKEAAQEQQAALQAELRSLREARVAERPQVAALESEQAALYAENQALNKQQAALGGEVRGLKQSANALTDDASQLRYKLSQAKGQGELLRSQIVQSPQKLQALLTELAAAVERERAMVADAGKGGWGARGGRAGVKVCLKAGTGGLDGTPGCDLLHGGSGPQREPPNRQCWLRFPPRFNGCALQAHERTGSLAHLLACFAFAQTAARASWARGWSWWARWSGRLGGPVG